MEHQRWQEFSDAQEGTPPTITVARPEVPNADVAGVRDVVLVRYSAAGAWTADGADGFSTVDVPEATHATQAGAPRIPTLGLLIALPSNVETAEVEVVDRSVVSVQLEAPLLPAPTQFREHEFREIHTPDPRIYDQENPYPGRDVDLIGIRTVEGVRVAQLYLHLGQYFPAERRMELLQRLTIKLSFDAHANRDATPAVALPRATASLIHGLELQQLEPLGLAVREGEPGTATSEGAESLPPVSLGTPVPSTDRDKRSAADADALKTTANSAPYIVVTTPPLAAAVAPLLAVNQNARTVVTTQITAEFPAASLEDSIRAFVGWALANWTPVKPEYLVLAGDTDAIPMHLYTRASGNFASDNYYVDHTGDLSPEIAVARIPTSDSTTMQTVCEHLATYRALRAKDGAFENRVIVSAYAGEPYESCADQVAAKFGTIYEVVKRYAKDSDRNALIKSLNDGVAMVIYRGHGSKTEWLSSNGLRATDLVSMTTEATPPMFLDICCENGWVDDTTIETLAEALIRQSKAVAVFASSRDSWTYPNNDFVNYLADAILVAGLTRPADIAKYAKTRMVVDHPNDDLYGDNLLMYNMFGDPAAPVAERSAKGQFFTSDGAGGMTPLGALHTGWRKTWTHIVPGDFGGNGHTGLFFYEASTGKAKFFATNGTHDMTLLGTEHLGLPKTWTMIIPGDFGGNGHTDLLCYGI
jgi:hypothetical protein